MKINNCQWDSWCLQRANPNVNSIHKTSALNICVKQYTSCTPWQHCGVRLIVAYWLCLFNSSVTSIPCLSFFVNIIMFNTTLNNLALSHFIELVVKVDILIIYLCLSWIVHNGRRGERVVFGCTLADKLKPGERMYRANVR